MDNNTSRIIEQLADKFGTTSEYLWGVLVNQAHISATISLVFCIAIWATGIVLIVLHRKYSKNTEVTEFDKLSNRYYKKTQHTKYESDPHLEGIMVVFAVIAAILFIVSLCLIPNIIIGFFNPEYWALSKVLKAL